MSMNYKDNMELLNMRMTMDAVAFDIWDHITNMMPGTGAWHVLMAEHGAHTVNVIQRVGTDGLVITDYSDGEFVRINAYDVFKAVLDKMEDESMGHIATYIRNHKDEFSTLKDECERLACILNGRVYENAKMRARLD